MAIVLQPVASTCRCFAFADRSVVVRTDGLMLRFSDLELLKQACDGSDLVEEKESNLCAMKLANAKSLPEGYRLQLIRERFYEMDQADVMQLARAKALTEWLHNTRYCGRCGSPLQAHDSLSAFTCPDCGQLIFPRIEPCIIVVVTREDKMLLARHVQRNQDIYACIAGFIEAGESAEHAVSREIYEETHLRVKNIRYFGSQSWPFPSQLMLGFTADYESGDIKVQADEIESAKWFSPDECPATPPPGSIAYELIEDAKRRIASVKGKK